MSLGGGSNNEGKILPGSIEENLKKIRTAMEALDEISKDIAAEIQRILSENPTDGAALLSEFESISIIIKNYLQQFSKELAPTICIHIRRRVAELIQTLTIGNSVHIRLLGGFLYQIKVNKEPDTPELSTWSLDPDIDNPMKLKRITGIYIQKQIKSMRLVQKVFGLTIGYKGPRISQLLLNNDIISKDFAEKLIENEVKLLALCHINNVENIKIMQDLLADIRRVLPLLEK